VIVYLARVTRAARNEVRSVLRAETPTHGRLRDALMVILDVCMEAYAITVVATLAGSIGTFLIRRAREVDPPSLPSGPPHTAQSDPLAG
jgi:hypothetical protein